MIHAENQVRDRDGDPSRRYWNALVETRSGDAIAAQQREGFARTWERMWSENVAFYTDRFAKAGLTGDSPPSLDEAPLTTKADLRADEAAHPPFGTHRTVRLDRAIRVSRTTGTSGRPIFSLLTEHDLECAIEMQCRTTWTLGMRPGDRFTHPWPAGLYVSAAFSNFFYVRTGVMEIPVGPPTSLEVARDHVELWRELQPTGFLLTMPQLQLYTEAAQQLGTDFATLTKGTTMSLFDLSMNFPGPRARIEESLGCTLRTQAGAGDIPGFGAAECEFRTGVHLPHDFLIAQVVDPATGRALPDGELGHLVVTTIGLDANLVRFDLEDLAFLDSSQCPCGRSGPRMRVLGRSSEALRLSGRTVLPVHVQVALAEIGAPEFRIDVAASREREALVIQVEDVASADEIREAIAAEVEAPAEVSLVPTGTWPTSAFKPSRVA